VNEKVHRITLLSTLGSMLVFMLILLFLRESTSILGIAFYIQIFLIIIGLLLYLNAELTVQLYDSFMKLCILVGKWIVNTVSNIFHQIKSWIRDYGKSKSNKDTPAEEFNDYDKHKNEYEGEVK
jgi:hypothetical protein